MRQLVLACFLMSAAAGLYGQEGRETNAHGLLALLPSAPDLSAQASDPPRTYSPGNLYQYNDGGAEAYLACDFVGLAHAVYQKGDAEVTVDVFDMGKPRNAARMYRSERPAECTPVALGTEGYQSDFFLNFYQDQYYVKVSGFSDTQKASQFLKPFAEGVFERISGTKQPPKNHRHEELE